MKTFHESDIRRRILILGFIAVAWFFVLIARLIQLQVFDHARYKTAAIKQNQSQVPLQSRRGNIYDRNGKILAGSINVFSVGLHALEKETPAQEAGKLRLLQPLLGLSEKEVTDALDRLRDGKFVFLSRKVSEEIVAQVRALVNSSKLEGVTIDPGHMRRYPMKTLAAHVLGGVNVDEQGRGGIERRFDEDLKGKDGQQTAFIDSRHREYQTLELKAPVPGKDITLTIDETIQYIAESTLARAVEDHAAVAGSAIICDPASGDVLALASIPTFDANDSPGPQEAWMNRAISFTFAPGSTFKIVSAAAALEKGVVQYSDTFDCSAGSITIGGLTIRDHEQMGVLTFPQVLIHSSNVGTVKFSSRLAQADLYETIRHFRFGEKTGIELPAEEPGRVWPVAKWNKAISLPHVAIGYEIAVTPIQILQAMNVYAMRGLLVQPRIIKEPSKRRGLRPQDFGPIPSVISEGTAEGLVSRVFKNVVEEGTGKDGKLEQFWIAGKTGTAQKYDEALKAYLPTKHIASFVGFVPAGRPALTMIIVLDDPNKESYYGGQLCAPVFRDIARQVLRYLRVPPEKPFAGRVITADLQRKDKS